MNGLMLTAEREPRPGYQLNDFEKKTGKAITGSSVWRNPKIQVDTIDDPKPGPDDVLIHINYCGICGSDVHFYETDQDGYMLYPGLTKFPVVIGHELCGTVEEVGKNVKNLGVGSMVTCEEMIWCGHCVPCRNGFPNHCTNLEEIGFTINGGFADYLAINAKYCWPIDAILERYSDREKALQAAAFCEPTSVAYNGIFIRGGGFQPGANVMVYGAGPIGLAAIALARAAGAAKIFAFEVNEKRRHLAQTLGADDAFDPVSFKGKEKEARNLIFDLTDGEGADMHVECAGAMANTIPVMESSLAINGKIIIIGRAADKIPMYLENLQVRRSQIFGSQGHSGHAIFPGVIRLMAAGRIDMTKAVTKIATLENAVEAIDNLSKTRSDGKIQVRFH